MTSEELEELVKKTGKILEEMYGDDLPNPEHCPKEFNHILKMYMYYNFEKE